MSIIKHFLLIGLLLGHIAMRPVVAQDDSIIPESDSSSGTFIPPADTGSPTPPVIIDDTDSSVSIPDEDYDN
jgi:hypothetical protein